MVDRVPNDPAVVDAATADEAIEELEEYALRTDALVDFERRLLSEDRSKIAKRIIWLFIVASMATILFIAYAILWVPDGPAAGWDDGAKLMVTVLSSVILPVVTLVIGYYFGTETKQGETTQK